LPAGTPAPIRMRDRPKALTDPSRRLSIPSFFFDGS
jgi:hypothetical protein